MPSAASAGVPNVVAVRVTITVHVNAGKLELKTPDAAQQLITSVNSSKAVLQSVASALNQGKVAPSLATVTMAVCRVLLRT